MSRNFPLNTLDFVGITSKLPLDQDTKSNKAPFGIPVTIRLGLGFPAKNETQPKNSVWWWNPTKFLFGNILATFRSDKFSYINTFSDDSTSSWLRRSKEWCSLLTMLSSTSDSTNWYFSSGLLVDGNEQS